MITKKVKITNPTGLHMRPAGIFCNKASEFECSVRFRYDNTNTEYKVEHYWQNVDDDNYTS